MRFTRPLLIALATIGAAAVAVTVLAIIGGNGGEDRPAAIIPTATAAPGTSLPETSTPRPATSPTVAIDRRLRRIDDGFVRTDLAPGEVPQSPYGIVLEDLETGEGEYWHFGPADDEGRGFYSVDPTHRWLRWESRNDDTSLYFGDRRTGSTYQAVMGRLTVLLGPTPEGLLLLRTPQLPNPTYIVIDLDDDPTGALLEFRLPLDEAFEQIPDDRTFLADGSGLLVGGYRVDLASGEITELPPVPAPGFRETFAAADGGWVQLSPDDDHAGFRVERFDAAGDPINLDASPPVRLISDGRSLSPDADSFYTGAFLGPESPAMTSVWPTIQVIDLHSNDSFRAIRVSPVSKRSTSAWLSDASGLVVATPDGFAVLSTDGLLVPLPFGPVEQSGFAGAPIPVPALHDPELFLYEGRILTAAGAEIRPAATAAEWASNEPWNDYGFSPDGKEIRLIQSPPPGIDAGLTVLTAFGLPAHIQRPPFPTAVRLRVDAGGDGLNLRDYPGSDGRVVAQIADGDLVTVTNGSGDGEPAVSAWPDEAAADPDTFGWVYDAPWWVHVETEAGVEGWVRSEFVEWAD